MNVTIRTVRTNLLIMKFIFDLLVLGGNFVGGSPPTLMSMFIHTSISWGTIFRAVDRITALPLSQLNLTNKKLKYIYDKGKLIDKLIQVYMYGHAIIHNIYAFTYLSLCLMNFKMNVYVKTKYAVFTCTCHN